MVITDTTTSLIMLFQPGLYWIIDPLCGWSYGALPLLNRVAQDFTQQHILPGGLFVGSQRRNLDDNWLAHVHEHDARIASLTGMPFGSDYRSQLLANSEIVLDSLPSIRGLLAAQRFAPTGSDLVLLNAIQRAWYEHGRDVTRAEVVNAVMSQAIASGAALGQIPENEAMDAIQHARMLMAQTGGQGFPTAVFIDNDGQYRLLPVSRYYGQPAAFFSLVNPLLTSLSH